MNPKLARCRDELAKAEMVYEPKYEGKDHSGYDTLTKYEVNYLLAESFERGFDACHAEMLPMLEQMAEALDWAADWLCSHEELKKDEAGGHRQWCTQCHNWVYPKDLKNKARAALAAYQAWSEDK